jgi:DNA repair exonuclease SbcCD nuclease subunit
MIFSDLHLGVNITNDVKLQNAVVVVADIIKQCEINNITDVIHLGDWFHDRSSISVKTLKYSYDILNMFRDAKLNLYMVIGNHDIYHKDKLDINSIDAYKEFDNVVVIDKPMEMQFKTGVKVCAVPWGFLPDNRGYGAMLGHFEFIGAKLAGGSYNKGHNPTELFTYAPLIFSGHFHLREEYVYKDAKIITVGSPLQHDWGDYNDDKGYYILHGNMNYEFIPNIVSPIHTKLYLSQLQKDKTIISSVEGNYVQFIVDVECKFDKTNKLIQFINSKLPIVKCEPKLVFNKKVQTSENSDKTIVLKNRLEQIFSFVDTNCPENLDKSRCKDYCNKYYEIIRK